MIRRIILGFIIAITTLLIGNNVVNARIITQDGKTIDTLDPKLVCEDTSVTQKTLRNSNVKMRRVRMYLYTSSSGEHITKVGRFYRQTIGSTEKLGFCVDMEKNHGSTYKVDDKEYEKWISGAKTYESDNPDYYAIRILTFEDAVKEEYKKLSDCFMGNSECPATPGEALGNVNKYSHLLNSESEEMIYNLAVIMSQISSWALSYGEPAKLMDRTDYSKPENLRIAMAQAICGIYGHKTEPSDQIIESCSYNPTITEWEKQSEEFRYWYNAIANQTGSTGGTEYGFVKAVWEGLKTGCGIFGHRYGCYYNNTYMNYLTAYQQGWKKPTLYIPKNSWEQRLLSDYYCEPETDNPPSGCWELNVKIPNVCKSSDNSGYVKDIEDWKCIFSVAKSRSAELKKHYEMDDANSYCNVFCQEKINMELPNYGTTTVQGGYMTVNLNNSKLNNILPVDYEGTKICRTTSTLEGQINWPQFEKDYAAANQTVNSKWDIYQKKLANYYACNDQPYRLAANTSSDGWYSLSSLNKNNHDCKVNLEITEAALNACNKQREANEATAKKNLKSAELCEEQLYKMYEQLDGLEGDALDAKWKSIDAKSRTCEVRWNTYSKSLDRVTENYATCLDKAERYCPPNNDSNNTDGYADFYTERYWPAFAKWYGDYYGEVVAFTEQEKKPSVTHETHCNSYWTEVVSAKDAYETALRTRDSYLSKINSCVGSKIDNIKYNTFNPKVKITYEEAVYGTEDGWILKGKTVSSNTTDNFYQSGNALTESPEEEQEGLETITISSKTCDTELKKCWDDTVSYERAFWWEKIIEIEKSYTLDNSVYRYVEKGTGQSIHSNDKKTGVEYLDMGIGNLPIHYSAVPNGIDSETIFNSSGIPLGDNHYDFKIYTQSFGVSGENKFNKYIFGNKTFNSIDYTDIYEDYECQYKVSCDPMIADNGACPSTPSTGDGLNLVYRTISMYSKTDAFPGQSGDGRTPGDNWTDSAINSKIVNNRGVKNYEVYTKLDPLYEIELTPGLMQKIRKYNKTVNSSRTTIYDGTSNKQVGLAGYSSYDDFECDSSGMNCKSRFIRGKIQNFGEIKVTGCAISSSKNGYNCSRSDVAW